MREILLEMYEQLWNADKDKWAWNVILKDTLEKLETFNTEDIHPDSAYGQWMKRFNTKEK
jgi:hypothetical protein